MRPVDINISQVSGLYIIVGCPPAKCVSHCVSGWARISRTCGTKRTTWTSCKITMQLYFHAYIYSALWHSLKWIVKLVLFKTPVFHVSCLLLSPAGTSWLAWSAWRPRCQGREGTPRSYRSHWTPRRAGREGRQRSAWASGIAWIERRDCKSDVYHMLRGKSTIIIHIFDNNVCCKLMLDMSCVLFQGMSGGTGPIGPAGPPGLPVSACTVLSNKHASHLFLPLGSQDVIKYHSLMSNIEPWSIIKLKPHIFCRVLKVSKELRVQLWVYVKSICTTRKLI